mmetsp:Transcript_6791/g.11415  ORF Transcript_6791/g.11415 Transcript_6791/m.11415 type:complete len:923 (-) Transcript_6791:31-2799(-)
MLHLKFLVVLVVGCALNTASPFALTRPKTLSIALDKSFIITKKDKVLPAVRWSKGLGRHKLLEMRAKSQDDTEVDDGEDSNGNEEVGGLWLKLPPQLSFMSGISWTTLIVGTLLGGVLTLFTLVAPIIIASGEGEIGGGGGFGSGSGRDITAPVTLFQDILQDLENDYVDNIDAAKLFKTGIRAMLQSLDPYTEFEDLSAARNMQESVSGKYGGVGLVIGSSKPPTPPTPPPSSNPDAAGTGAAGKIAGNKNLNKNKNTVGAGKLPKFGVTVQDAFEGYAYDADIRTGDRLLSVDGKDVSAFDVEQVRDLLRGDPDTDVVIQFQRNDFKAPDATSSSTYSPTTTPSSPTSSPTTGVRQTTLRRQQVRMSDIKLATLLGSPEDAIGYINLSGFNAGAGKDFRNALLTLRHAVPPPPSSSSDTTTNNNGGGGDLKGLVLDLRGNPGGLLDQAVEVSSYLVPQGSDVVSAKGNARNNDPEVVYRSSIAPLRPRDMKLVVLVNKGSASASEIVSGAIQDLDAGLIVGPSTTYGKGLVQKIVPLPYDSALKYTIAKYYTPSGRCIQAVRYTGGRGEGGSDVSSSSTSSSNSNSNDMNSKDGSDNDAEFTLPKPQLFEEGNSVDLTSSENVNGAMNIPDNERNTFYTLNKHRAVRDGGGIEPDVKVPSLQIGPAENTLFAQNVYADFVSQYVVKHDVRRAIRLAANSERIAQRAQLDFGGGSGSGGGSGGVSMTEALGPSLRQFFVPNHDVRMLELQNQVLRSALTSTSTTTPTSNQGASRNTFTAAAPLTRNSDEVGKDLGQGQGKEGSSDSDSRVEVIRISDNVGIEVSRRPSSSAFDRSQSDPAPSPPVVGVTSSSPHPSSSSSSSSSSSFSSRLFAATAEESFSTLPSSVSFSTAVAATHVLGSIPGNLKSDLPKPVRAREPTQ